MKLSEIKTKAKAILDKKDEERLVGAYLDLLEMEKQTLKQLEKIRKSIKKFEDNPDSFVDRTENLW
jgi:hypothetical protein